MTIGDFAAPGWRDVIGGVMVAAAIGVAALIEMLRRTFKRVRGIDHAVNNAGEGEPTLREMVRDLSASVAEARVADARLGAQVEEMSRDLSDTDAKVDRIGGQLRTVDRGLKEHIAYCKGVEAAKGQA